MNDPSPATAISPLRQRLIDDMNVRRRRRSATTFATSDLLGNVPAALT